MNKFAWFIGSLLFVFSLGFIDPNYALPAAGLSLMLASIAMGPDV